jgi:hypothetical protein
MRGAASTPKSRKDAFLKVDHHSPLKVWTCCALERLVDRILVDVVVAVLIGLKVDNKRVTCAILQKWLVYVFESV